MKRASLRSRVLVALAVTLALSIAGILGMRVVATNAQETQRLVNHTLDVIASAEHLGRLAFDAQAAMRGYLLLGDRELALRFAERSATFNTAADALSELVADNPQQVSRAREIRDLHLRWEDAVRPVVERHPNVTEADRAQLREGAKLMDKLTTMLAAFTRSERALLAQRRSDSESASEWTTGGVILVVALAVLVACGTAFSLALRVARDANRLARAASAIAEGDLSRRITAGSNDELATVSSAFNQMADRLERRAADDEVLERLRGMLQASQTSQEAHAVLERLAPQCLPASAAQVYVIAASRNHLTPIVGWGDIEKVRVPDGFAPDDCWALRSGRIHVVRDPAKDITCAHRNELAGPSLCLPLVAQGESVGLLYLAESEMPRMGTDVGELIGLTLANLRLRDVLRNQAIRDPLTGLFNRRYLEETLVRELGRVRRRKAPLAVIVLDVDHFKRFNDTYGHHGGDVMLREVASTLTASFRESDIVCRYGGEEFVVIAPECAVEAAIARTEEMRTRLRAIITNIDGRSVPGPTVSAGIAIFPDHGQTPEQLFQAADRAVYRSKGEGRDRITVAS